MFNRSLFDDKFWNSVDEAQMSRLYKIKSRSQNWLKSSNILLMTQIYYTKLWMCGAVMTLRHCRHKIQFYNFNLKVNCIQMIYFHKFTLMNVFRHFPCNWWLLSNLIQLFKEHTTHNLLQCYITQATRFFNQFKQNKKKLSNYMFNALG